VGDKVAKALLPCWLAKAHARPAINYYLSGNCRKVKNVRLSMKC